MLIVVQHPFLACELTVVRNRATDMVAFRHAMHRVGIHLAVVATQNIDVERISVETPLELTSGFRLKSSIAVVVVLRSGLLLLDSFLDMVPQAQVGYAGVYRDEQTLQPREYYWRMPHLDESTNVVVLDPMLATGGSALAVLEKLVEQGARQITFVCVIAAPEGIERITNSFPDIRIVAAAVDRELNDHGYILPGLGDAGDRAFGTQS